MIINHAKFLRRIGINDYCSDDLMLENCLSKIIQFSRNGDKQLFHDFLRENRLSIGLPSRNYFLTYIGFISHNWSMTYGSRASLNHCQAENHGMD